MDEELEAFLFFDELPEEQRKKWRAAFEEDPALAEAAARWQRVREQVRKSIERHIPDRRLLILYALKESGRADLLSQEEAQALEAARADLEAAFRAHPALEDVVRHIQEEQADFEEVWERHARRPSEKEAASPQEASSQRTARRDRPSQPSRRRRGRRRWVWRAVVGAVLIGFAVVLFFVFEREQHRVTIEAEDVQRVELAGGSTVRLMPGARLSYIDPEAGTSFNRQAELSGDAFFEIASAQEGFTVETPTAQATVLGTSFGVEATEKATEVVLAEGKLALAPKEARDDFVVLAPGQMSRVAQNARPSTPVEVDLPEELDWTGLFVFRNTPIGAIAERLSAHYDTEVVVGPDLQGEEVTGTFEKGEPLEDVLRILSAALGAEVEADPEGGYRLVASNGR